jgi:MFS family permease
MKGPTRPWAVLIVLCIGTFAVLLDTTIVNVALPSLVTSLHASIDQALWTVNGYLMVFCSLLIVGSRARPPAHVRRGPRAVRLPARPAARRELRTS